MDKKFKDIYRRYKYLATTPAKVDMALLVAFFSLVFVIFGIDFCNYAFANTLSISFVAINIIIFGSCFIYIAKLREEPDSMPFSEKGNFNFRKSLKMTRLLQKELVEIVAGSGMLTQKENNSLRLLSFVVVFNKNAFLFIRQSEKVENRKDHDLLMAVANDIADNLGLSISVLLPLNISTSIGLGHYHFQHYEVMQLR
ncbi:hypothetical protein [Lactobacillus amylovorus]|uniref:hypothetical protein n=1 Tax=Lactobacillus amylovorus TaxID=1604 RepID=UPI003F9311F9